MNIATEPTAPTMKAAVQIIAMITLKAATIASKPQIARRINILILLRGVEKAAIMIASFFDSGCYPRLSNGLLSVLGARLSC
jgi:hypothetical protein